MEQFEPHTTHTFTEKYKLLMEKNYKMINQGEWIECTWGDLVQCLRIDAIKSTNCLWASIDGWCVGILCAWGQCWWWPRPMCDYAIHVCSTYIDRHTITIIWTHIQQNVRRKRSSWKKHSFRHRSIVHQKPHTSFYIRSIIHPFVAHSIFCVWLWLQIALLFDYYLLFPFDGFCAH